MEEPSVFTFSVLAAMRVAGSMEMVSTNGVT
jgi:hypothetical protein